MRALDTAVCTVCGKKAVSDRGRIDVRKGQKVFHLDCYRTYKHRAQDVASFHRRVSSSMTTGL
jgi:hypothetical protein